MTVTSLSAKDLLITKGPLVSILTSRGAAASGNSSINIPQASSGWGNNVAITDALTCTQFNTASNGALSIPIEGGMPRVLIETSKRGSLCGSAASGGSGTKSAAGVSRGIEGIVAGIAGVLALAGMVMSV